MNSILSDRVFPVAGLALVFVLTAACGASGTSNDEAVFDGLASLYGRLTFTGPPNVVPDRFWETDSESGRWGFRGYAALLCVVDEPASGDLHVVLAPEPETSRFHFMASLNGDKLWPEPRRLPVEGSAVTIPGEGLTAGVHRIELRRVASADTVADRAIHDNRFVSVGVQVAGHSSVVDPAQADRFELLRAFVEDGVVGTGPAKNGGWLVLGNATAPVDLRVDRDTTVVFDVKTVGTGRARFTVTVDGRQFTATAGQDPRSLEVPMAQGERRLHCSVEGSADGLHLWGAPRVVSPSTPPGGSVIFVTLDTTRRDVLSPYGGPKLSSPNIEKLAAHSTVFDNAWAVSPWTLPSHASLFAGVYPSRHGAGVHRPRLDPEFSTLAEAYRSAGYRTAGFAGGEMTASHWGVAQGFEVFYDPEGFETPGDRLTDLAQAWLEDVGDAPFFLFLNYFDPHADYRAPEEFENLFAVAERGDRIEHLPEWRDLIAAKHGAWRRIVYEDTTITRDALDYLRAAYLAEVAFMDHQLGRLFETLVSRGLYDDATIVLVADHGEFLGEGGYFSHSTRLEPELTAIPLIIKWPRQHSPERVVQLVSHVDLVPTLLEVSRLPAFIHDGTSLTSAGREAASRRDVVFMEEHESRVHPLIGRNMVAPHLYGLQEDSARQIVWEGGTECAWLDDPAWEIVECEVGWRERMSQLEAFASTWRETDTEAGEESLSDDMRRRLEALGYVR